VSQRQPLSDGLKRKISLLCDVPMQAVISAVDHPAFTTFVTMHNEGLDTMVCNTLGIDLDANPIDLSAWREVVRRVHSTPRRFASGHWQIRNDADAYLSVGESIRHAGFAVGARPLSNGWRLSASRRIDSERIRQLDALSCGRLRRTRRRGHDRRGAYRARARHSLFRSVPRHAVMVVEFAAACLG